MMHIEIKYGSYQPHVSPRTRNLYRRLDIMMRIANNTTMPYQSVEVVTITLFCATWPDGQPMQEKPSPQFITKQTVRDIEYK